MSDPQPRPAPTGAGLGGALVGGRLTHDPGFPFATLAVPVLAPPPTFEGGWRMLTLSPDEMMQGSATRAMDLLLDMSPDVSRALWDFLRMCNPGFEVHARPVGADETATDDPRAMAAITAFFDRLRDLYGSVDVVINRLNANAMVRGALFGELVLDPAGRLPIDFATPDPVVVRFQRQVDPERGQYWQVGQLLQSGFVPYDRPTIRYIPIDPAPGSPYGRPMIAPALFASVFLLGILHDLRRVVQEQGYPHRDIAVKLETLIAGMPQGVKEDQAQWQEWVTQAISQVQDAIKKMRPEDTFVHTDDVEVNKPQGGADASSLGGVRDLMAFLERWLARALKTTPLLMGLSEGTSEANANRQWEIYAAGIKAIQHHSEALLERLLEIGLQAQGIVANVEFRFAELRTAELLRDAQVEQLRIANEREKYAAGWTSQDEGAEAITGHPAEQTEPVDTPAPPVVPPSGGELAGADPGSNRETYFWVTKQALRYLDGLRNGAKNWEEVERFLGVWGAEVDAAGADTGYDLLGRMLEAMPVTHRPDRRRMTGVRSLPLPVLVDVSKAPDAAATLWDETMPEVAGLLDAEVEDGAA